MSATSIAATHRIADNRAYVISGTPAKCAECYQRAMKEAYIGTIINFIDKVLKNADDVNVISTVKNEVKEFMKQFPLYPELG